MKRFLKPASAFSLVEVTLALGVAAFCLITVFGLIPVGLKTQQTSIQQTIANNITSEVIGDLRAAYSKPGNSNSSQFGIQVTKLPPGQQQKYTPTPVYFALDGTQQNGSAGAVFKTTITYFSATDITDATLTLADITTSWPAAQADLSMVTGSVETVAVIDRKLP
jgi:uncharacterized protein (TIGR02598 family)